MGFMSETLLKRIDAGVIKDQAFIMMPFGDTKDYASGEVFSRLAELLAESDELELRPIQLVRADSLYTTENVMARIWDLINRSGILIADLSRRNANVLYEIGLCHSLGRDVILITDREEDVPVDLRVGATYLHYADLQQLLEKLPRYINRYLEANRELLFAAEDFAARINQDRYLRDLFQELCEFDGRYVSQHIDHSSLRQRYAKKKYSLCLSDFYFVQSGLFRIEGLDEYGSGTLQLTEYGSQVRDLLE